MSRGAVGKQTQLLLFDTILHLATGTIQLLVKHLSTPLFAAQRGHKEARVGALGQVFGFAHHAPLSRPTFPGAVDKILEHTRRFAGVFELRPSLLQLFPESALQPSIARQPEDKGHAVALAPTHQLFTRKPRISTYDDAHLRPPVANP